MKPTIGHSEWASGMASLIKVIKALQNKYLPGIPDLRTVNSEIDNSHSMVLQPESRPWTNGSYPRRAALNSYAVGGVNAHIILEEYKGNEKQLGDYDLLEDEVSSVVPDLNFEGEDVQIAKDKSADAIAPLSVTPRNGKTEPVDVMIIGAGISGLVSACYLAKQGRNVQILEAHSVPGGYLQTYNRKGYKVEAIAAVVPNPSELSIIREVFRDHNINMEWVPAPMSLSIVKNW